MILHNIGAGARLEDTLFAYDITGRFRYRPGRACSPSFETGLRPFLRMRNNLAETTNLILRGAERHLEGWAARHHRLVSQHPRPVCIRLDDVAVDVVFPQAFDLQIVVQVELAAIDPPGHRIGVCEIAA